MHSQQNRRRKRLLFVGFVILYCTKVKHDDLPRQAPRTDSRRKLKKKNGRVVFPRGSIPVLPAAVERPLLAGKKTVRF
jgi:hypothetical protein